MTWGTWEYLVKQPKDWDVSSRSSLEREAFFYRNAAQTSKPWADFLPQCFAYDPLSSILVIEFLPGHKDLGRLPDRFSPGLAALCGKMLGTFHRDLKKSGLNSDFPRTEPWCLSFHEMTEDPENPGKARSELLRVVRGHAEFGRALDWLRSEWRVDTLIHGDCKLENCLLSADRSRLRLVDWEVVSWGDSIWDVSGIMQSYWNFWIRNPLEFPVESIRPALGAFLAAYAEARGLQLGPLSARAIRFAGARMLQTGFESLKEADEMTGEAARLLQGSLNILARPEWAAEQILGTALTPASAHA